MTSGSYNFFLRRNEMIKASMRAIRGLRAGSEPNAQQITDFSETLNLLLKQWQGSADFAPGLKIFSRKRLTLFLAKGQQRYLIGPSDGKVTEQYGRTTISANEAAGQTILSITSNTDTTTYPGTTVTMTSGDYIGIELNDGTIQWTTISGTPSTTATVSNALTSAAGAGNYVWWFTSKAQMPLELESAVLRDQDYKDISLTIIRDPVEYEQISDKQADGDPCSVLFEPLLINAALTLDYQPSDVTKVINLLALYQSQDMDSATDEFGFSQVWQNAIKWGLAKEIAPECGTGLWLPEHQSNYESALSIARNVNPEVSDAFFEPGRY